ncbi:MAG: UDP-N-acetylmuramoyl-tripeptide--D-alanyl-D-alanine ligase [Gammaproteobacteria bacterium]
MVMQRTLAALAEATDGRLVGRDIAFGALVSDSRRMEAGALFVCLKGPRYDGHDYAEAAVAAGAGSLLTERAVAPEVSRVEVVDTLQAMGKFARAWRDAHRARVVAVTGSNGKTTTKNLLAAVLAEEAPTFATQGNLNNRIGLPLTLACLDDAHRYAVVELGISLPGEMAELAAIARPNAAIVTNVAPAHLEGFGDVEGVAREKGALPAALAADGLAVAPADLPWLAAWREACAVQRWLTFGFDDSADVCAQAVELTPDGTRFELVAPTGTVAVELRLLGRHNIANALAAAALASGFGVPLDRIARGLARVAPAAGRMSPRRLASGAVLIDDSYNANPASLMAAVATAMAFERPLWLALGDLGELGADAATWHRRLGRELRDAGVARLYTLGPLAARAAAGFGEGGQTFENADDLAERLATEFPSDAVLLVKGSRSARMERIVAALGGGD